MAEVSGPASADAAVSPTLTSERLWRAITENSDDTVLIVDRDLRIRYINRTIPPTTPEQIVGTSVFDYVMPAHHEMMRAAYKRVHETGETVSYESELDTKTLGIPGGPLWFATKVIPITADGAVSGALFIASDITARKMMEQAVFESEERWRSLTENSDDNIQMIDRDGIIRYINRTLPPATKEQVLGTSIYLYVNPSDHDTIRGVLEHVFATGTVSGWETTLDMSSLGQDGPPLHYSVKAIPTTFEGEVSGAFLIATDVTAQKRHEEELRRAKEAAESASQAKSTFLANMSHEVRTPLNAIIGLTEMALASDSSARVADYLRKVRSSSRALLGVINDILDFSRIEAGRMVLDHVELDIRELMWGLEPLVGPDVRQKGLELHIVVDRDVPALLIGDPLRLHQVLTNLVQNAIKFTSSGVIVVRAQIVGGSTSVMVRFSVRDTGVGIPQEDIPRIFDSFTQLDASSTRKHGGAGLGLAICKRLVDLMNGDLEVESTLGEGSTFAFTVELPRAHASEPAARLPETVRGKRALVVDDHPLSRESLAEILESFGTRTMSVASIDDAIAAISRSSDDDAFSLVVVGSKLGSPAALANGWGGGTARAPKVIAIAAGHDELSTTATALRADRALARPITPSALLEAILDAFGGSPAERLRGASESGVRPAPRLTGVRVLVVEDLEVNQLVVRGPLEHAGAIVSVASDGRAAIRAIESAPFDVVLMDVQMPGMDGLEVTRVLRKDGRFADLPIIALTAHAMRGDRERCLEAGMNDYVSKPIHAPMLLATIAKNVARRPAAVLAPDAAPVDPSSPADVLDFAEALRVVGSAHALHGILRTFAERHATTAQLLRRALGDGDHAAARDILHALIGVAGNLRARELLEQARSLHERLKGGDAAVSPRDVGALDAALTRLLETIASLPEPAPPAGPATRPPPGGARSELDALEAQLAANSMDALDALEWLTARPVQPELLPLVAELISQIERLRFDDARLSLRALRERLQKDEGT